MSKRRRQNLEILTKTFEIYQENQKQKKQKNKEEKKHILIPNFRLEQRKLKQEFNRKLALQQSIIEINDLEDHSEVKKPTKKQKTTQDIDQVLEKIVKEDNATFQKQQNAEKEKNNDSQLYFVEKILDRQEKNGQLKYMVK